MNELQSILLSDMPLLISADGYRRLMVSAFPLAGAPTAVLTPVTYREECQKALAALHVGGSGTQGPVLTMDYGSQELQQDTVAYHRVWGFITAESRWCFSTKQLERDLLDADANPLVSCHLLHVKSPGGEAYYLDRLDATFGQLHKPVVTLYEMMCSAAYRIGCHGSRVYATTQFDYVGCIGTMVSYYDFQPYYEKLGIRLIEVKADQSDLKNKKFDDVEKGKPRQYIDEVLNPLNAEFLQVVRAARPQLAPLPDDHPAMRGETYFTQPAQEVGLCDGQRTLQEVAAECYQLGVAWRKAEERKSAVYRAI